MLSDRKAGLISALIFALALLSSHSARSAPAPCSAAQSKEIDEARKLAQSMLARVAEQIEDDDPIAVAAIVTWLGVNASSEAREVANRLRALSPWLDGATFLCDSADPNYAWVYSTQPFLIRIGSDFLAAPKGGYSSKAGTLIHEVSHFLIAGASKDPPKRNGDDYGTADALVRARNSPLVARNNAENLEYFVEATYFGLAPP